MLVNEFFNMIIEGNVNFNGKGKNVLFLLLREYLGF